MSATRLLRAFGGSLVALGLTAWVHAAASAPLADAAMNGDSRAVMALLKQAADVNAAQGDGMTALHWAAMRNDAELAQTLLYAGANLRATTRIGNYTPLLLAARGGNRTVLETLVKGGAEVDVATSNGTTALMFAAQSGSLEAVTLLLDKGADINAHDAVRGLTPVMFAAAANRPAVIELLARRGADLRTATKVTDLAGLSRDPKLIQGIIFGNPPPPPKEGKPQEGPDAQGGKSFVQSLGGPASAEEYTKRIAEREKAEKAAAEAKSKGEPARAQAPVEPAKEANAQPAQGGSRNFAPPAPGRKPLVPGIDRQFMLNELVYTQGGLTPLLFAARQGNMEAVRALITAGADVNQVSAGDRTSPLLIATINGHFDVARYLLDHGADPTRAGENGATPLYGAINCEWAPKALYPQPRAHLQQHTTYLELMKALLDKGADPNARLRKKVWYSGYSFDLSGVDEIGATAFWRAAYASDVEAMKLLVAYGADPNIRTMKPAGRPRTGDGERDAKDVSGLPPVPTGGPGITPLMAAAGAGYGEGFAANAHRFAPTGMLAAVKYLVDDLHANVNDVDHEGNSALHHAAARGDNEMITFLVSKGADVRKVNREGKTTVDMANGPVQRIQPFPETIALLEKLGAKNNHKCVSC